MSFTVIDTQTGKEPDIYKIALTEKWAGGLMHCDMDGFHIDEDGALLLADECGRYAYCPHGRFEIMIKIPEIRQCCSYVY